MRLALFFQTAVDGMLIFCMQPLIPFLVKFFQRQQLPSLQHLLDVLGYLVRCLRSGQRPRVRCHPLGKLIADRPEESLHLAFVPCFVRLCTVVVDDSDGSVEPPHILLKRQLVPVPVFPVAPCHFKTGVILTVINVKVLRHAAVLLIHCF